MAHIYLKRIAENVFVPILTMDYSTGVATPRVVAGYYPIKLQDFIRNNKALPQDGYLERLPHEVIEQIQKLVTDKVTLELEFDGNKCHISADDMDRYYDLTDCEDECECEDCDCGCDCDRECDDYDEDCGDYCHECEYYYTCKCR